MLPAFLNLLLSAKSMKRDPNKSNEEQSSGRAKSLISAILSSKGGNGGSGSEGFSGETSAGEGVNVGGTNAAGEAMTYDSSSNDAIMQNIKAAVGGGSGSGSGEGTNNVAGMIDEYKQSQQKSFGSKVARGVGNAAMGVFSGAIEKKTGYDIAGTISAKQQKNQAEAMKLRMAEYAGKQGLGPDAVEGILSMSASDPQKMMATIKDFSAWSESSKAQGREIGTIQAYQKMAKDAGEGNPEIYNYAMSKIGELTGKAGGATSSQGQQAKEQSKQQQGVSSDQKPQAVKPSVLVKPEVQAVEQNLGGTFTDQARPESSLEKEIGSFKKEFNEFGEQTVESKVKEEAITNRFEELQKRKSSIASAMNMSSTNVDLVVGGIGRAAETYTNAVKEGGAGDSVSATKSDVANSRFGNIKMPGQDRPLGDKYPNSQKFGGQVGEVIIKMMPILT